VFYRSAHSLVHGHIWAVQSGREKGQLARELSVSSRSTQRFHGPKCCGLAVNLFYSDRGQSRRFATSAIVANFTNPGSIGRKVVCIVQEIDRNWPCGDAIKKPRPLGRCGSSVVSRVFAEEIEEVNTLRRDSASIRNGISSGVRERW